MRFVEGRVIRADRRYVSVTDGNAGGDREDRCGKVARLVDEHDLHGLGAELKYRWTAEGE